MSHEQVMNKVAEQDTKVMRQRVQEVFVVQRTVSQEVRSAMHNAPMTIAETSLTQNVKKLMSVKMAKKAVSKSEYKSTGAESGMSAGKRSYQSKHSGYEIHRKTKNREKMEQKLAEFEEYKKSFDIKSDEFGHLRLGEAEVDDRSAALNVSVEERALFTAFADTRTDEEMVGLLERYGRESVCLEAINDVVKDFVSLNFNGIDMSSDEAVIENATALNSILEKLASVEKLLSIHPEYRRSIPVGAEKALDEKICQAREIANLYAAKVELITDKYYASHKNSELSYVYRQSDSLERRSAIMRIHQVDHAKSAFSKNAGLASANEDGLSEEKREAYKKMMPVSAGEYGKNMATTSQTPIERAVREIEGTEIGNRLQKENFRITGCDFTMTESFTRHLFNLTQMRAIRYMDSDHASELFRKLAARPKDPANPVETARCREQNLEGMRECMDILHKQVEYLKKKYGRGLSLISPEEIRDHDQEFHQDFTNMQGWSEFMSFCERVPGFSTEGDFRLHKEWDYFQASVYGNGAARNFFKRLPNKTFGDYKKDSVTFSMELPDYSSKAGLMKDLHADVRWGTFIDAEDCMLEDVSYQMIDQKSFKERLDAAKQKPGFDPANIHWTDLFPELALSRANAEAGLEKLIDTSAMECAPDKYERMQTGVAFSSTFLKHVANADLPTLNIAFCDWYKNPKKLQEKGFKPDEINEFNQLMARYVSAGKILSNTDFRYSILQKTQLRNIYAAASSSEEQRAMLAGINESLDSIRLRYEDTLTTVYTNDIDPLFKKLNEIRLKHNLNVFDEYHAKLVDNIFEIESDDQDQRSVQEKTEDVFRLRDYMNPIEFVSRHSNYKFTKAEESLMKSAKNLLGVKAAKKSASVHEFEKTGVESDMTAGKRSYQRKHSGYEIHRKSQNRDSMLALLKKFSEEEIIHADPLSEAITMKDGDVQMFGKVAIADDSTAFDVSISERKMISRFFTLGDDKGNLELLEKYGDKSSSLETMNAIAKQYMNLSFDGLDMSTDEALIRNAEKINEIALKTDAIEKLARLNRKYFDSISFGAADILKAKMEVGKKISSLYYSRIELITDEYYATHKNSELSYVYRPGDSLERRSAIFRILAVDHAKKEFTKKSVPHSDDGLTKEQTETFKNMMPRSAGEYGKNVRTSSGTSMQEVIRRPEIQALRTRLAVDNYYISGYDITMTESFTRYMDNLTSLRSTRYMDADKAALLLKKLAAKPVNPDDPVEVAKCQKDNLEAAREFITIIGKHVEFLKKKYGRGFSLITPEEIKEHDLEFHQDFSNMQGWSEFIAYMEKIPNFATPDDYKLHAELEYYQCVVYSEGYARNTFKNADEDEEFSFHDYKVKNVDTMLMLPGFAKSSVPMKDLHSDVRWGTFMDSSDCMLSDIFYQMTGKASFEERYEKLRKSAGFSPENLNWTALFPELSINSGNAEAMMRKLVDTQLTDINPDLYDSFSKSGVVLETLPEKWIKAADQEAYNKVFEEWLDKPELLRAKGLDTDDIAEFKAIMTEYNSAGEKIRFTSAKLGIASDVNKKVRDSLAGVEGDQEALLQSFNTSINDLMAKYGQELAVSYTAAEPVMKKLTAFRGKHNLFVFDEHKDVYENELRPLIDGVETGEAIMADRSWEAVVLPDQEINAEKLLKGKKLKADPETGEPAGETEKEFDSLMFQYNQLASEYLILNNIIKSAGDGASLEQSEFLNKHVPKNKGMFVYDLTNRKATIFEGLKRVCDAIKGLIE